MKKENIKEKLTKDVEILKESLESYSSTELKELQTLLYNASWDIKSKHDKLVIDEMFSNIINHFIIFHHDEYYKSIMFVRSVDVNQFKELGEAQKYLRLKGVGWRFQTGPYYDSNYFEFATDFEIKEPAQRWVNAEEYRNSHPNCTEGVYYDELRIEEITPERYEEEFKRMKSEMNASFEDFYPSIYKEFKKNQ